MAQAALSPALTRLLRHVASRPELEPVTLGDAADVLRDASEAKLRIICRELPVTPVQLHQAKTLHYASELRYRLSVELDDLELSLPEHAPGLIDEVLATHGSHATAFSR